MGFSGRLEDERNEAATQRGRRRLPLHARIQLLLPVAPVQPDASRQDQEARGSDEESGQRNGIRRGEGDRTQGIKPCSRIKPHTSFWAMAFTVKCWIFRGRSRAP